MEKEKIGKSPRKDDTPYPERNFGRPAKRGYSLMTDAGKLELEECELSFEDGDAVSNILEIPSGPASSWNISNSE